MTSRWLATPQCWSSRYSQPPHLSWTAEGTFQGGAIPVPRVRRRRVGGREELEQQALGFYRFPHRVVRQNELPQRLVVTSCRGERATPEARRLGVRVRVKHGERECRIAWPETDAADLVGIGLARYRVG